MYAISLNSGWAVLKSNSYTVGVLTFYIFLSYEEVGNREGIYFIFIYFLEGKIVIYKWGKKIINSPKLRD